MSATTKTARIVRFAMIAAAATSLTACGAASRIADIGKAPELSSIQDPQAKPGYQPVSLPMPTPLPTERNPNSLWRTGAKAFFKDQRASKVGDIMTINISINDSAKVADESKRSRANTEAAGMPNLFGLEGATLSRVLPAGASASNLVNLNSNTSNDGKGSVDRNEKIDLKVAALVTQTLPNGNLVIQGHQEVRVNFEVRDLQIHGVIRPEDITAQNTVSYEKIAEARISYGGRGQITDVQQPRYGQQLYDIIMPF
ncbi:flagellar basal body L-ring protein FlgH [Azospirillum sp. TSO35-2]|uniref:flagellar basal body L-ring protein FlgH n=1 Tax=Azospirillum sp. TSO35-2 TaxID=716796 RepID=UPI000D60F667|nr:flagellar basal body L-ring protein FlgH [Azospirillum sp. TSO35-2]PWC33170.1 flagellar biosynthesis protein FlgH [Azospirillum sp. TSO35-2]